MKIFKFMAVALVAILGFNSCSEDCDHNFIEHNYTKEIVGTWTYLAEDGLAEAMVIKEDGSFAITGVMHGGSLYEEKGTIKVVNNKVTLTYASGDVFEGRLEFVAGKSLSLVMFDDNDVRLTYDYCANDLSDEIVGMWVCNEASDAIETGMAILTFDKNGKGTLTTGKSVSSNRPVVNKITDYKVVGDLLFRIIPEGGVNIGVNPVLVTHLVYAPNGTTLGDMIYMTEYVSVANKLIQVTSPWLRVKQSLNLADKTYAYNTAYVTNAKGKDEDFAIMGHTFNIAKIKASDFNVMFGADLFLAEFPNSNTMKHRFHIDGQDAGFDASIAVEGNKVSIDMSVVNPALRKVDMYMFQDANDSQLHMYMPTASFINYFANMELYALILEGKLDTTNAAAVEKVFADMEARVESINVSFVFKAFK